VVQVEGVSCVRLEISFKSFGSWEAQLGDGWNGGELGVACCVAISATKDRILGYNTLVRSLLKETTITYLQ